MAFYQTQSLANFSVNDPFLLIQQQISQLQSSVTALNSASPNMRLFMNYNSLNPDYFNQPSNINNLGLTMDPVSTYEETIVSPQGKSNLEAFATVPTELVLNNQSILQDDKWIVQLYIKTSNPNTGITLPLRLYQSLTDDFNGMYINLTNPDTVYAITPSLDDQPVLHTFEVPIITTVSTISSIAQVFCVPDFVNNSPTSANIKTYFGGETPSFISMNLTKTEPLPANSWINYSIETGSNLNACTFQLYTEAGPILEPLPFVQLATLPLYALFLYNTDTQFISHDNSMQRMVQQNVYNNEGNGSSYLVKMVDVYEPSNYALMQVGPAYTSEGISEMLLSPPIDANGTLVPTRVYTLEFIVDGSNEIGVEGPYITPPGLTLSTQTSFVNEEARQQFNQLHQSFRDNYRPVDFASGRLNSITRDLVGKYYSGKFEQLTKHTSILKVKRSQDEEEPPISMLAPLRLPTSVDLRNKMKPVMDQGDLGSCTACSLVGQYSYKVPSHTGSALFLYYNERVADRTINYDAGSTITTGIRCLQQSGLCTEAMWPYIISKFTNKPSTGAYNNGLLHKVTSANKLSNTLSTLKSTLANGNCFTFGFLVYSSFQSASVARTGIVPLPSRREQLLGGHAVTCCGYDDARRWFIIRNSWGTSWGASGYFYMPYSYVSNSSLSWDFWVINSAT